MAKNYPADVSSLLSKTTESDNAARMGELIRLVEQSPDNELYRFSLAKAYFDEGRFADCVAHLGLALGKKADWMAATSMMARAYQALGRVSEARKFFSRAAELAQAQGHETAREEILNSLKALES